MLYEFLKERGSAPAQPMEEVHEAMRKTFALQLTSVRYEHDPKSLDEAAIRATAGKCLSASLFTLWLLAQPGFDKHILLTAWEQDTPRDRQILDHAYFLVRDVAGAWYAGSPANYTLLERPEALEVHTGTLESVTGKLHVSPNPSQCRWPTAEVIEAAAHRVDCIVPFRGDDPAFEKGNITVFEMQSIHARTAGLRFHPGVQSISYDFTWVLPRWSGGE